VIKLGLWLVVLVARRLRRRVHSSEAEAHATVRMTPTGRVIGRRRTSAAISAHSPTTRRRRGTTYGSPIPATTAVSRGSNPPRVRLSRRSGRAYPRRTAYPTAVAHARGAIWVLDYYANTLTRVDPKTNKVTGRLTVGQPRNRDDIASRLPASLMAEGHNLWVTNDDRGTVTRVIVP
jgi:DNA-binding beta-propeller fold protein YncE